MRFLDLLPLICALQIAAGADAPALSEKQLKLRDDLGDQFRSLQRSKTDVLVEPDGWLFFTPELRLLSVGKFWGDHASETAPRRKQNEADPLAAIVDFNNQLKERGIELLVIPVPLKAAIYADRISPEINPATTDPAPFLTAFYDQLRTAGVPVLDLASVFSRRRDGERGPLYCRTDTHWSGQGCVLAAEAIAAEIRAKLNVESRHEYSADWHEIQFTGDLAKLLPPNAPKSLPETLAVRMVRDASDGARVQSDPNSPLLLLGDSHTLVFHEFYADTAGLLDQLSHELGFAPDLIGTQGSGATAVRVALYRKAHRDPKYLSQKKVIAWCFSAREFTEADGWPIIVFPK